MKLLYRGGHLLKEKDVYKRQYQAVIDIKNHNGEIGLYNIHAYKYKGSNHPQFITAMTAEVCGFNAATGIQMLDQNPAMGTFRAQIINVTSPATITNVRFAVWTENNGQDDIKWYEGSHSGNVWYVPSSPDREQRRVR